MKCIRILGLLGICCLIAGNVASAPSILTGVYATEMWLFGEYIALGVNASGTAYLQVSFLGVIDPIPHLNLPAKD